MVILSQNVSKWQYARSKSMLSRTKKPMRAPASSKSFIVMEPFVFSSDSRLSCISCGYATCHRNGLRQLVPLHQTPLAPSLQASV